MAVREAERDLNQAAGPRTKDIVAKYRDWLTCETGGPVLDIGCGDGTTVTTLTSQGVNAVGIDLGLWDWPRGTRFLKCDGYRLPFRDESFDAVGSLTVLEHLDRPEAFLREMVRVVRLGGRVVVATPNMYGSVLLHPGDSVTHTGGLPRYVKNLGLHLKKQIESVVSPSKVGFDRLYPDMTNIPEGASDYDAICATDPAVLRAILRRFGVRVVYQSASLEYSTKRSIGLLSNAVDKIPFVRDLFGGIFVVGRRAFADGHPQGASGWLSVSPPA